MEKCLSCNYMVLNEWAVCPMCRTPVMTADQVMAIRLRDAVAMMIASVPMAGELPSWAEMEEAARASLSFFLDHVRKLLGVYELGSKVNTLTAENACLTQKNQELVEQMVRAGTAEFEAQAKLRERIAELEGLLGKQTVKDAS